MANVLTDYEPHELELLALSSMTSAEIVRKAQAAGLGDSAWQVEDHARTWEYLVERANAGEDATAGDVYAVTGIELIPGITDVETFVEELVREGVRKDTIGLMVKAGERLRGPEPQKVVSELIGELSGVFHASAGSVVSFVDADADRRLQRFVERKRKVDSGGYVGLRTGLPSLDSRGFTWRGGEMVAVQGPLNVGKSTLILWFCAYSWYHDQSRILFLSPESTVDEVEDKVDPMIARFMGYNLSNTGIRTGRQDEEAYAAYLRELALLDRRDFIVRDSGDAGTFSVEDIVALVREHSPDILAIDGVHLITGEGKSWERMKAATDKLKGLGQQMKYVTIGGTQVQRDAVMSADEVADPGQSGYGMAFMESANKVISLAYKRGDPMQRVWKLVKHRGGEKLLDRQYLRFDVDGGDIREMKAVADATSGAVDFV